MNIWITYGIIAAVLLACELVYFRIADRCNIIDKPNERSSHSTIVLRGGGIIFVIGMWVWGLTPVLSPTGEWYLQGLQLYPWLLAAVTLAAGVSFVDDVQSLPDSVRLVAQFAAMGMMMIQLIMDNWQWTMNWWMWGLVGAAALTVCVGATNIYNFMDGINGITAGYSLAVLVPLLIKDGQWRTDNGASFVDGSLLIVMALAVLVFSFFNFRPKGKAKCFAGDVGSVGMAFILLFCIGRLIAKTEDVTWLVFLLVYGVDGCCTIVHRIMLHENLGKAHRKHAYQIMANELGMSHVVVSLIYMGLQLAVSLSFIYLCPDAVLVHWIFLIVVGIALVVAYVLFMRKHYHLHEEYLEQLKANS